MGTEHDGLTILAGPSQDAAHVARLLDVVSHIHLHITFHIQGKTLEARLLRSSQCLVHVHTSRKKQFPATVLVQPSPDGQFAGIARIRIIDGEIVAQVAIHTDMPPITGGFGMVEHQTTGSTLTLGLFKLI